MCKSRTALARLWNIHPARRPGARFAGNWIGDCQGSTPGKCRRRRWNGMSANATNAKCCSLIDSMIVGSGIDLIEIGRIQQAIDRYGGRFLNRVYTSAEQSYCLRKRKSAESFAARFAAKEAGAKALGTGISFGVNWLEFEVIREPSGRPTLKFHGRAAQIAGHLGVTRAALSITHTADLAMASIVLENGG